MAPALIESANGGIEMVQIFRFGVLGALFHSLLLVVFLALAYFDLRRMLVQLSLCLFVLNALLTLLSLHLGVAYYGWGYMVATLVTLVVAVMSASGRLERLPFVTFVANNAGLR